MRTYSPYRRGFGYYLKRIIVISALLIIGLYVPDIITYCHRLDSEKILSASKLKDKTFSNRSISVKIMMIL